MTTGGKIGPTHTPCGLLSVPRPGGVLSTRTRIVLPVIATTAALVAMTGCTSTESSGSDGSKLELVNSGKLTTCTHLPYEPFQSRQDNKIVGFDVDLVDLVAKELKVTQEIVDTPFEGIQTGEDLNARKCDVAAAGMTITPVREENLDFSAPTSRPRRR